MILTPSFIAAMFSIAEALLKSGKRPRNIAVSKQIRTKHFQKSTKIKNEPKEFTPQQLYLNDHTGFDFHYIPQIQQVETPWSHFRISSTDSTARATLYSIINSTTGKYCSVAFI